VEAGWSLEVVRLQMRLGSVKKAVELYNDCTEQSAPDEQFNDLLDYFVEQQIDFPSSMKQKLLGRRLKSLVLSIKEESCSAAVREFIKAVTPFPESSGNGEPVEDEAPEATGDGAEAEARLAQPQDFQPKSPSMNQMDGSLQERLSMSHRIVVYDVLQPLIMAGERMATVCKAVVKGLTHMYEEAVADLEEIPESLDEMLTTCRAVVALLDVTSPDPDVDAVTKLRGFYKSNKQGMLADVAVYLHTQDYYKTLLEEFFKYLGGLHDRLAKLSQQRSLIENLGMDLETFVPGVRQSIDMVKSMQPVLRPGSTFMLEKAIQQKFKEEFDRISGLDNQEQFNETEHLGALAALLASAKVQWPGFSMLDEMETWVAAQASASAEKSLWANLLQKLEETKALWW